MEIATVEAAATVAGVETIDLDDVTHGCLQCGTTVTRTMRRLYRA